ncbi:hypothetical protein Trydic_g1060 [Trypoxylus dichotomus]
MESVLNLIVPKTCLKHRIIHDKNDVNRLMDHGTGLFQCFQVRLYTTPSVEVLKEWILDCKTRWSSLVDWLKSFDESSTCAGNAIVDLKLTGLPKILVLKAVTCFCYSYQRRYLSIRLNCVVLPSNEGIQTATLSMLVDQGRTPLQIVADRN